MLTNTYECLAIILRLLRLVANCIRKPIRLIFATFWRICREYIFLHSQGYSPQCESSMNTASSVSTSMCVSTGQACLVRLAQSVLSSAEKRTSSSDRLPYRARDRLDTPIEVCPHSISYQHRTFIKNQNFSAISP